MFDYLVVGAGPFGSTFARLAHDAGKSVLVVDKRDHIAGNLYDRKMDGILVHEYGPHLFHTNDDRIWSFVNQFGDFRRYEHRVLGVNGSRVFPVPINLMTMNLLWGVLNEQDARKAISKTCRQADDSTIEGWCLKNIGTELYELVVKHYTEKHWGITCDKLPAAIIKRLPVRFNFDNRYFSDKHQGVPVQGYTKLVENMLDGIEVQLGADYFDLQDSLADRVIYTGPIDLFYSYEYGKLGYRSLRFEHTPYDQQSFQGCSSVRSSNLSEQWTRRVEWNHLTSDGGPVPKTVVTREYPVHASPEDDPYYPVRTVEDVERMKRYTRLAKKEKKVVFGGRLGSYRYLNMDQVIASAFSLARKELGDDAVRLAGNS